MLAGLLAIPALPVSQFPNVAPPQISITANYPGASATTVMESVTSVIEEELNGTKGLLYFDSSSGSRSEEHTSELQSQSNLVCRLLLEKKKYQLYYAQHHSL